MKDAKILALLAFVLIVFISDLPIVLSENEGSVCIYFFYSSSCPHCIREKSFLEELSQRYSIELYKFEISMPENSKIWEEICKIYDTRPIAVPMTFIGRKVFIGFTQGDQEIFNPQYNAYIGYSGLIERTVREYAESGGVDCPLLVNASAVKIFEGEKAIYKKLMVIIAAFLAIGLFSFLSYKGKLKVKKRKGFIALILTHLLMTPFIALADQPILRGDVGNEVSLFLLGMLLGILDGAFNPCALSTFFFLVAYLLSIGSKRKCLVIGLVYSTMIFIVYTLFMLGFLNLIQYSGKISTIKKITGILLFFFGAIKIKDFLLPGKWFSLEIPRFFSPYIESLVKAATTSSAIILGLLVALVEIPCAGAFPFFYTTLLASKGIYGIGNILYIIWYNIFFVSPLILLTILFYLGISKVEEAEKRRKELRNYMKLISGMIMILLGALLFVGWV